MHGFTLVELLITTVLTSVLLFWGAQGLPELVGDKRANAALYQLRATISYARHAAITHQAHVIMCPTAQQRCNRRDTWHLGITVFIDRNRNNKLDPTDDILSQTARHAHGRLYWRAFRRRSYLLFTPRGFTDWQNGHFLYCPNNGKPELTRQLVLNVAGRTYSSRDSNGDGVHEDIKGKNLVCT